MSLINLFRFITFRSICLDSLQIVFRSFKYLDIIFLNFWIFKLNINVSYFLVNKLPLTCFSCNFFFTKILLRVYHQQTSCETINFIINFVISRVLYVKFYILPIVAFWINSALDSLVSTLINYQAAWCYKTI